MSDKIPGGLADEKPDSDFDPKQLAKGQKVELEHTKDPALAKEIAKDHLTEQADYYTMLEKVEKVGSYLERIAITYEEYKKLHPRTRKQRNDPMFTKPSAPKTKAPKETLPPVHYDDSHGSYNISLGGNTKLVGDATLGENFGWWLAQGDHEKEQELQDSLPYTNVATLESITVDPAHQGQGLGSKMLKSFINECKKQGHDAIFLNASPIPVGDHQKDMDRQKDLMRFYAAHGFKTYEADDNHAIMILPLDE